MAHDNNMSEASYSRRAKLIVRNLRSLLQRNGGVFGAIAKARIKLRRNGFIGLKRALVHAGVHLASGYTFPSVDTFDAYADWVIKYDTLTEKARSKIRTNIAAMKEKPLISVVMPVYNPDPEHFDAAIRSVKEQLYPCWELCIADDASTVPEIREIIDRHAQNDPRIKCIYRETNGHICRATNSALELAQGEFVGLLDHDDILAEHALYWVAAELAKHPDIDIFYSDSDWLDDSGQRHNPYFKPDFNPELMLSQNLVSHFGVYRHSMIKAVGGLRVGFEGSQDYDLSLRVLVKSAPERVHHIPAVLYHWRRSKRAPTYSTQELDRCIRTAHEAIQEYLSRKNILAVVAPAPKAPQWQRIIFGLPNPAPKVSIIVPTKNNATLLERCITGLLNGTDYQPFDITIVDNDSVDPDAVALISQFEKNHRIKVLHYSGVFNFSAINNLAVGQSEGDILAFLNNDIEIVEPGWLQEMVSHAARPDIGAVGAKLYYPNGNIQHAGVTTGIGGVAGHLYKQAPGDTAGRYGETILTHAVTAVTAACMVVRRSVFLEAGGFNEIHLAVAFNDVDLCLRLFALGYRNIFTPFAELVHHESATRGADDLDPEKRARFRNETQYMLKQWAEILAHDPFFNPNRSLDIIPKFAGPPRRPYPWEE